MMFLLLLQNKLSTGFIFVFDRIWQRWLLIATGKLGKLLHFLCSYLKDKVTIPVFREQSPFGDVCSLRNSSSPH